MEKLKKLNMINLVLAVLWLLAGIVLAVLKAAGSLVPLYFPIALAAVGLVFLFIYFEIRRLTGTRPDEKQR